MEQNKYIEGTDHSMGIITCGIAYNYLMENFPEGCPFPVLKLTQYPLPKKLVRRLAAECKTILVVEEGQPLVERMIRGVLDINNDIKGRLDATLPRTGELTPDALRAALGMEPLVAHATSTSIVPRLRSPRLLHCS